MAGVAAVLCSGSFPNAYGARDVSMRHGSDPPETRSASFEFTREGLQVSHWKLVLHADGSGTYTSSATAAGLPATQPIRIGPAIQEKLAAAYPIVHSGKCETKLKHIAKTGSKVLTYQGADAQASAGCTFNYSDSEALNSLADVMIAVAGTIQAGERIAQKHRYDRLGLDAELDVLMEQVKSGQAVEIRNIAPVLQSVAEDEQVMDRVQRKAARLLQEAGGTSLESAR